MDFQEIKHQKKWKYAQAELERKFLFTQKPENLEAHRYKIIEDIYLEGTRLRLRKTIEKENIQYKLTKKIPIQTRESDQQWVSTIYLSEKEYEIFSFLPGHYLKKKRYYYPIGPNQNIGIDEIVLKDRTLWIAEIEASKEAIAAFEMPLPGALEITHDKSYFGNEIARLFSA